MRIDEALKSLARLLSLTEQPSREAEILLMHFASLTRTQLYMAPEDDVAAEAYSSACAAAERRQNGEPMAYILGYKDFYKDRFLVTPAVLIPRPETELLVELAAQSRSAQQIADLGAGSGCLGLSILRELPQSQLWTCDISAAALEVARKNALALGLDSRVHYELGDVTGCVRGDAFDLVVANPPYIDREDRRLEADVRKFEPASALFAADHGLEFYRAWLPWAYRALRTPGRALFEFGEGQGYEILKIAEASGFATCLVHKDLSEKERVLEARKE